MFYKLKRCALAIFLFSLASIACSREVIVNSSLPVSAITQSELRSIFSMKVRRWPNDAAIKVFILRSDSVLHREFCLQTLEVFPYQLQRIWDVTLFSGTGTIPVEVANEQEMLEKIATTPNSIGYVSQYKGDMPNVKKLHVQKTP